MQSSQPDDVEEASAASASVTTPEETAWSMVLERKEMRAAKKRVTHASVPLGGRGLQAQPAPATGAESLKLRDDGRPEPQDGQ